MNAVQIIQNYAIVCQNANFSNDTKNPLKSRKKPANPSKTWQRKVRKNYDKSIIHLPRQHLVIFSKHLILLGLQEYSFLFYDRFMTQKNLIVSMV